MVPFVPTFGLNPTVMKAANTTHCYKLALRGDKPGRPTGGYYALIKHRRKQFRRSLKTRDRTMAERRLCKLRDQIGNLDNSADTSLSFEQIAKRWLSVTSHTLKPRSIEHRHTSLKGPEMNVLVFSQLDMLGVRHKVLSMPSPLQRILGSFQFLQPPQQRIL